MNQQNEFSNNHHKSNIEDLKGILPDYLSREGITDLKHNFTCLNPKHADKNPSMTYYSDSQTVYCHGCNASFDIFDLFAIEHLGVEPNANNRVSYPNGFNDVYNQLAEYMNVDVKRFKVSPEDAQQNKINEFNRKVIQAAKGQLDQTDYLKKRGISQELAQKFEIGFIPKWVNPTTVIKEGKELTLTPTPRLIIPTSSNSYLARDTRPSEDISANEKKYVKVKQGSAHIFNAAALANDNKPIFIVEGELDALSILEVTDKAQAVALGSTSNVDLFCKTVRIISNKAKAQHMDYEPVFLIATDNDNAGKLAGKDLETQLTYGGFENYTVDIAKGSKDPNEALTSDRAKFTNEVEARIKDPDDYLTSLITRIQDRKDKPQYVPTGFNNLDKLLDGGLYPQLYVLGAVSSVGKTTFSMQIADRIAATQGKTIFYFSLETSKDELTEKNLSRLSFELANESSGNPQTARSINNGYWLDHKPEFKLVMKAINTYSKYYSLIHIFDGTLNRPTANTIYKKMKAYRRKHPDIKPVVIVDYLQILKPIDDKDTDKEKVTKSIAAFKSIASELEIPVIVISSFNRSSYQSPVAMESFKESGEIEYYADTLLGLQYRAIHDDVDNTRDNIREAMQKEPRDIELVVLKNRNGRSNTNINFEYYPKYNDFIPLDD